MSLTLTELRLAPWRPDTRPPDLVRWFLDGWAQDMPMDMTTHGDYPEVSEWFVAWLEHPGALDRDEAYRSPMRAALRALAGRGRDTPGSFMALVLVRLACLGGDWDKACAAMGIPNQVRRPYVLAALDRLYLHHAIQPRATVRRKQGRPGVIQAGEATTREATGLRSHALR
jgi:hypothetical protein